MHAARPGCHRDANDSGVRDVRECAQRASPAYELSFAYGISDGDDAEDASKS